MFGFCERRLATTVQKARNRKTSSPVSGRIGSSFPCSASSATTSRSSGLCGAMLSLRSTRRLAATFNHLSHWSVCCIASRTFSVENRFGMFSQIVFQDIEQVIRQAVRAMALAVFLHLREHAAQNVGVDVFFAGDFVFHFTQSVEFFQVSTHVGAKDGNEFGALLRRDGTDGVGHERGDQRA